MATYKLLIKAALQGCTDLQRRGGFNHPDNVYDIKVRCNRCKKDRVIHVRLGNTEAKPTTRKRTDNWKSPVTLEDVCKNCGHTTLVQALPGNDEPYARNSKVEYKEVMKFIFDGALPLEFLFRGLWEYESLNLLSKGSIQLDEYVYKKGKKASKPKADELNDPIEVERLKEPRILYVDSKFDKCTGPGSKQV